MDQKNMSRQVGNAHGLRKFVGMLAFLPMFMIWLIIHGVSHDNFPWEEDLAAGRDRSLNGRKGRIRPPTGKSLATVRVAPFGIKGLMWLWPVAQTAHFLRIVL